jgi:hypothetical protein
VADGLGPAGPGGQWACRNWGWRRADSPTTHNLQVSQCLLAPIPSSASFCSRRLRVISSRQLSSSVHAQFHAHGPHKCFLARPTLHGQPTNANCQRKMLGNRATKLGGALFSQRRNCDSPWPGPMSAHDTFGQSPNSFTHFPGKRVNGCCWPPRRREKLESCRFQRLARASQLFPIPRAQFGCDGLPRFGPWLGSSKQFLVIKRGMLGK